MVGLVARMNVISRLECETVHFFAVDLTNGAFGISGI
jgi:hypothetical protein